jgi:hypothetical protein
MNTIAYIIYICITSWITIVVGNKLHKHGYWYIIDLFTGNVQLTNSVNKLLLIGYYLLNIGYVAATIAYWQRITSVLIMVELIVNKIGIIIIGLAIIHYINMAILMIVSRMQKQKNHLEL